MLDRYKKSGGFIQLLTLIETCGPQKQEKFLKMIRDEDPLWEIEIRKKVITVTAIFKWNQVYLAEIVTRLQPLTLATALKGLSAAEREYVMNSLKFAERRTIEEIIARSNPSPAEISTSFMRIIMDVRGMVAGGLFKLDKIDPTLHIPIDIEERLARTNTEVHAKQPEAVTPKHKPEVHGDGHYHGNMPEEVDLLKKQILALSTENLNLKRELKQLNEKLNHIKKIA